MGAVELKGKTQHVSEVVTKLTNCLGLACRILRGVGPAEMDVQYYPVLVSRGIKGIDVRAFRQCKVKVTLGGTVRKFSVILKKSNISFEDVVIPIRESFWNVV